jgi:AraC-like DNA-binding protein
VLLATFTPAGASAFVDVPLDELAGTTTDCAGLLESPEQIDRLHEALALPANHSQRIAKLEEFLRRHIRRPAPDALVQEAVARLQRGPVRIDALAREIGLSQSALERRFRRVVGLSPKSFASVTRLRRAVRLREKNGDSAEAAVAAGYFDQSHFIHDFHRATGHSPQAFFRQNANH